MRLEARGMANERLCFELFTAEHAQLMRTHEAADSMWKWMPACEGGASLDGHVTAVLAAQRRGEVIPFIIRLTGTGEFAGCAAFKSPNRTHRCVQIGYVWHPARLRGTGVFREAQVIMLDRAFGWGAKRVEWSADTRNTQAISAIERLGASRDGVLRQSQRLLDGSWSDVAVYSMLRADWPAARQRIIESLAVPA